MRMRRFLTMASVIGAGALGFSAIGQITPIGPFTGDHSETFEDANHTIFQPCIDSGFGRTFDDTADMCTIGGSGAHETTSWGFFCTISSHGGSWFMASASGFITATFDTPITSFGGYFGSNAYDTGQTATAIANFYDDAGGLIGSVDMDITNSCDWTWNGWSSTVPVKSIELINGVFGGAFLDMDDLEVSAGSTDCLTMTVSTLLAGSGATWDISGATPNSRGAVVFGLNAGSTVINGQQGFCATFGIQGVNQNSLVGMWTADGAGNAQVNANVPSQAQGLTVLTQAAEQGTCPDECVSGVDTQVVQ